MAAMIENYSFKEGLPQELEILDIASTYKQFPGVLTAPHRTGFYHVLWFHDCNLVHVVDFKPLKIEPNTVLFVNRDAVQLFEPKGNYQGKAIYSLTISSATQIVTSSFCAIAYSSTTFLLFPKFGLTIKNRLLQSYLCNWRLSCRRKMIAINQIFFAILCEMCYWFLKEKDVSKTS
jgi:hypothetical protein